MKNIHLVILMTVFTTLAGCGSGEKTASSGSSVADFDACALLTSSDVETELGGAVQKTDKGGSPTGTQYCHWYGPAYGAVRHKGITVMAALDNGLTRYNAYKAQATGIVEETGIGDGAYSTSEGVLTVYRGNAFLQIGPMYNGTGHTLDMSKRLAIKALARLP